MMKKMKKNEKEKSMKKSLSTFVRRIIYLFFNFYAN